MLNIGLIGCGRIGKMHAETVVSRIPDARLAAVCDVSEEAAAEAAQTYGAEQYFSDYRKVLDNPGTVSYTHLERVFIRNAGLWRGRRKRRNGCG